MRIVNAVLSGCLTSTPCHSLGRLTSQKAPGTRRAPSIRWTALAAPLSAESHCATAALQPSTSWARTLDPPQSGSRSSAAIKLLLPSGATPQSRNGVELRDERPERGDKLISLVIECCNEVSPVRAPELRQPPEEILARRATVFGGRTTWNTGYERCDSTTESHLDVPRLVASSALDDFSRTSMVRTKCPCEIIPHFGRQLDHLLVGDVV